MTAIQRAGSFANANLHFHTLVPEGVWHERADGAVAFHPLPPPTDEDVEAIGTQIVRRVTRLVARRDADPDGRVEYRFRRPDPTGRTSWVTDGPTWCRRLATLIPPRRRPTTGFHGVLASAHRWRARVVPTPARIVALASPPTAMTLARRLDWVSLLRSVFGEDVTRCPRCGDHVRVLAFLTRARRWTTSSCRR